MVRRVAITGIKTPADIMKIRTNEHGHSELRDRLYEATRGREGKAFEQAVVDFVTGDEKYGASEWIDPETGKITRREGIRHVRIIEPLKTIPIRDKNGRVYKGYKGDSNYAFDVWSLKNGNWVTEVVSTFDAHRPGWQSAIRAENPTAKKILSLKQGDIVAIDRDEGRRIMRVVKFKEGQVCLADHNEAGSLKARDGNKDDTFKYVYLSASSLKKSRARQVRIDEIGEVSDPGAWWDREQR